MKKVVRILLPILMAALVVGSIGWYLFVYDRDFTRDMLLREARVNDMRGNTAVSAWFYNMAYAHSGNDKAVAIELANQYKAAGNYTKTEVTLSKAIQDSPSADLYAALCRTYVEQDKLMDAVALLNNIPDEAIRSEIDRRRPSAPTAAQTPGFYNQYISIDLMSTSGRILYTTNGEYPSIQDEPFSAAIKLPAGETIIYCLSVDDNGLVSPLSVLGYTVGGVVEPAVFMDAEMEFAIRDTLGMNYEDPLYTNDLWGITDLVVPNNIWTLEDLSKLPQLKSLTVHNAQLTTLSDIAALTDLESLDLTGCTFPIDDLELLKQIPGLKKLVLSDCGISTIAGLAGLDNLTYLDISKNTVRNLDPIRSMEGMQELYLQHNAVTSLEALTLMYSLDKLDISFNAVYDLTPLGACANLTWLDASNNQLTNVAGLTALSRLTHLALDYNQLSSVAPLGGCIQLVELSISNNQLYDISALASLSNLEIFDFSYNSVADLPGWSSSGSALRKIEGAYNGLTNVFCLGGMPNLTYVSLDYNHLSDINVLADCPNLVQVNVYGNEVTDVSALTDRQIIVNYNPT